MVKLFANTARDRGKTPVVFILPTAREIVYYRSRGQWIYQPLVSQIEKAGIPVYNLGEPLLARLGEAGSENGDTNNVCDLFCTKPTIQGGHYTERGNALLADVAFTILSTHFSAKRR
jgi:hypothetical protein